MICQGKPKFYSYLREYSNKPKVLVICGRNKRRSRTAEFIFKNDDRFEIRSAGLSSKSEVQVNQKHLNWADIILVMDNQQRNRINSQYEIRADIHVLDIKDNFEYQDPQLIKMLTTKINIILSKCFGL